MSRALYLLSTSVRRRKGKMGEKQLRCKDCKWYRGWYWYPYCERMGSKGKKVNPGQFPCKKFVYPDK